METWHRLPSLGSLGSFRIRARPIDLLSSRILDAGRGAGIVPALATRSICVSVDCPDSIGLLDVYLLARHYLPQRDAIFAAALYATNPYYIVIVYWRSAFANCSPAHCFPCSYSLSCVLKKIPARQFSLLALIVAAAWLSNIPSAVMLTYFAGAAAGGRGHSPPFGFDLSHLVLQLCDRISPGLVLHRAGAERTKSRF